MFSGGSLYRSGMDDGKLVFDLNDFRYFGKEEETLSTMSQEIYTRKPIDFKIELHDGYRRELADHVPETKKFLEKKRMDRLSMKRKLKPIDAVAGLGSTGVFLYVVDSNPIVNFFGSFGTFFISTSLTCYIRDRMERNIAKNTGYIEYLDRIGEELSGDLENARMGFG